jgi:hypothetical protein
MKMTLKTRLYVMTFSLICLSILAGGLGMYGMAKSNDGLKTVYEDRTIALEQISRIDRLLVRIRLSLAEILADQSGAKVKPELIKIDNNMAEIDKTWADYRALLIGVD